MSTNLHINIDDVIRFYNDYYPEGTWSHEDCKKTLETLELDIMYNWRDRLLDRVLFNYKPCSELRFNPEILMDVEEDLPYKTACDIFLEIEDDINDTALTAVEDALPYLMENSSAYTEYMDMIYSEGEDIEDYSLDDIEEKEPDMYDAALKELEDETSAD